MVVRPETKRRLINAVLSVVVLSGLIRFFSGELSRKDEIHERERTRLMNELFVEKQTVETLKTELKEIREKKKIVRTKDAKGNEREEIVSETDTTSESTEYTKKITELEAKISTMEMEKEYIRKTSTPVGGVNVGYSPISGNVYGSAEYTVFGPATIEFVTVSDQALKDADIFIGIGWNF